MAEISVPASKFAELIDYLDRVGIDSRAVTASIGLSAPNLLQRAADEALPALQYARLYRAAAREMQKLGQPIPWAAGVGSEAFDLMCHCIISAHTLGEALQLATRFEKLFYPLIGYNIRLLDDGVSELVKLSYRINVEGEESDLVPEQWERAGYQPTVSRASGLEVWHGLCGWLTGQPLDAREVRVAAPFLSQSYFESLAAVFRCPIYFDAEENTLAFPREALQRRIVHTPASLDEFLETSIYHLIAASREPASTSAAIKSLVSIDLPGGMPSFASLAQSMHMSESSLRRRLQKENTSYQALKDEVRCEIAIDRLLNDSATIAELSEFLGFTEPSSFVRSFKGWTGYTPKNYRERAREMGQA